MSGVKQKVYLVDVDNGESYDFYRHWITEVFSTYKSAIEWLQEDGYESSTNADSFKKESESGEYRAKIIEMEVN